jgi:hypothetical protein
MKINMAWIKQPIISHISLSASLPSLVAIKNTNIKVQNTDHIYYLFLVACFIAMNIITTIIIGQRIMKLIRSLLLIFCCRIVKKSLDISIKSINTVPINR